MEWLGPNSNWTKASLVIFAITLSLLILTLTSNFNHYQWFSKENILPNERVQNMTIQDSALRDLGTNNHTKSNIGSTNSSSKSTENHDDIFLDGLLASGFDEESCLSRFQSYLYRKVSPHKPSPYLVSKLRSYEHLHRRCGPQTKPYKRIMKNLNRLNSNFTIESSCKYIIWTPANGLGNRMVSLAATFLYAILTNRVLLVEFHDDMVGLFCEPFPNSSWLLHKDDKGYPFSEVQNFETYQSMLKRDKENSSKELLLPSILYINMVHSSDDYETFFSCDHSQNLLHKVPLLILKTDQYFVPSLFMVPSFSEELSKMFPNKDTVFHHLGRYLFLPSNDVWGQIKRFYQAYLAKSDEKIGLQIRVFHPRRISHETVMNQVLNCTQNHKILPNFSAEVSKDYPVKNQILKSVLVTSLYPEYGENLRTMYLNKPTVTGEIIGVYQPSHEDHQIYGDNLHNKKALIDIYLLSFCDVLVTSSVSTFGYVAQSLGGIKPLVLRKLKNNNIPDSPCWQDISMEPCFHIRPKLDCMEKPIGNISTNFPYIRKCLDYRRGVKLISDLSSY